jgi:hypothetical protein
MKNKRLITPMPVKPASPDDALNFVLGLNRLRKKDSPEIDEAAVREYLNSHSLGDLQAIARRLMMDILKAPPSTSTKAVPKKSGRPKPKRAAKRSASRKSSSRPKGSRARTSRGTRGRRGSKK